MKAIDCSKPRFSSLLVVSALFFVVNVVSQSAADSNAKEQEVCGQAKEIRDPLIDEAEREQFNVRRVEIAGSTYTRDREFRKRMIATNEGDIFARKNLEAAVRRIAKMTSIYPITMDNIEVRLDRAYKDIDIVFCVKQKPKR